MCIVLLAGSYGGQLVAEELATSVFGETGVHAVVGGAGNVETLAANSMFAITETVHVSSVANDATLGNSDQYPYSVKLVPIESFSGMVWQHVMCNHFQYRKLTIFATFDYYGTRAAMEATDDTYCDIGVLSIHYFRPFETDFSAHIADAKAAGARIFTIFADPVTSARLLEQGHDAGLFTEGTQVFGSGNAVSQDLFDSFSSEANVVSIMKGYIGLRLVPSYSAAHTTEGQAFMSRLRSQDSTAYGFNGLGEKTCDKGTDDDGGFYLYMMSVLNQTCAGLDFSTLYQNASNLDPYAVLTYDAAYVVARGLHVLLYDQNTTKITGAALRQAIIDNVTFTGASGYIDIYEGMEYLG